MDSLLLVQKTPFSKARLINGYKIYFAIWMEQQSDKWFVPIAEALGES